jgi:UDP-N-acetylglucosamine 2-epimerase (non-hydrolysing)
LKDQKRGEERTLKIVKDYDVHNVSEKVVRIILSYRDYAKRLVWKE